MHLARVYPTSAVNRVLNESVERRGHPKRRHPVLVEQLDEVHGQRRVLAGEEDSLSRQGGRLRVVVSCYEALMRRPCQGDSVKGLGSKVPLCVLLVSVVGAVGDSGQKLPLPTSWVGLGLW